MGICFSRKSGSHATTTGTFTVPRAEHHILSKTKLKAFTYNELRMATGNFRYDWFIGEGGFGYVYKGWIDARTLQPAQPESGMPIAVKKLKPQGYQGHEEWRTEVDILDQLKHRNVVRLFGFCMEEENRLLVYEFMPRGSLEGHLFNRHASDLTWERRIKIAIDAAQGLAFLHSGPQPVIFRDFKTANILLDSEYNAKLSDFGYAKAGPTGDLSHVSTRILGTHGYADPEYLMQGHLTTKSDVYSFGVVLFELLAGRRVIDHYKPGRENLLDYVKRYVDDRQKISMIMDINLGHFPKNAAYRVSKLAAKCIGPIEGRPSMAEVVEELEKLRADF